MCVGRRGRFLIRLTSIVACISIVFLLAWCLQATDETHDEIRIESREGTGAKPPINDRMESKEEAKDDNSDSEEEDNDGGNDASIFDSSLDVAADGVDEIKDSPELIKAVASHSAAEGESVNLSKVFSLQYLPKPVVLTQDGSLDGVPQAEHFAIFLSEHPRGSSRLRGDMLAAAVSAIPGWSAVAIKSFQKPHVKVNRTVDFCVFVKKIRPPHVAWCKEIGAKTMYWDLVDNCPGIQIHYGWKRSRPLGRGIVILAPDDIMMKYIRYVNPQSAIDRPSSETLYHQHTNPGFLAPRSRLALPYICRAALFGSNPRHSPGAQALREFERAACKVPEVWSFALLKQIPGFRQESHPDMHIYDTVCPDRSEEMKQACMASDEEIRSRGRPRMLARNRTSFPEQYQFHSDVESGLVDVIFVMTETHWMCARHRPSTRVLHWMSHGVPVVFYPCHSYIEVALKGNYTLPDGSLPVLAGGRWAAGILSKMVPTDVRANLRRRGLILAANYSILGAAERLVDKFLHPEPVQEAYPGPYYNHTP